jgi:NADPH:quinone reductase-like Zn-dependent oxidoreductase
MKYTRVIVTHYGGPDTLRVIEEECPEPRPGEVRVRVLTAGVAMPDVMAREGIHPETPAVPYTPGWDLVGEVERLGEDVAGFEPGQAIAAMPIHGAYAEVICLPQRELVPVPSGLDAAEAVSLVLNYITAFQMLHRSAKVRSDQRVLIHGASGGVGTALLQLGSVAGLEMYGTCSSRGAAAVSALGGVPIDYQIRISCRKFTGSQATGWTRSSTLSVARTFGSLAKRSVQAGRSWAMATRPRSVERDWAQVGQVAAIAFMEFPFMCCSSLVAGCSQAGNG